MSKEMREKQNPNVEGTTSSQYFLLTPGDAPMPVWNLLATMRTIRDIWNMRNVVGKDFLFYFLLFSSKLGLTRKHF